MSSLKNGPIHPLGEYFWIEPNSMKLISPVSKRAYRGRYGILPESEGQRPFSQSQGSLWLREEVGTLIPETGLPYGVSSRHRVK